MPAPLLRRPAPTPYFYPPFSNFSDFRHCPKLLIFFKKNLFYAKEFKCANCLCPIVGGMGSCKMHWGEVSFLKMDRELLGGHPSTFWCYHFSLKIECKMQLRVWETL